MKYSSIYLLRLLLVVFIFFFAMDLTVAQPNKNTNFPCYTIATTNNGESILYEMNPATSQWKAIGAVDRNNIKALAIEYSTNTLYSVDKNKLGTINPITAQFNEIGTIGSGNGIFGTVLLNDIYGLTYVPTEQVLYATHRIPSYNPQNGTALANTNDILFKIDPATGKVIQGEFDFGDDYTEIEEVTNSTVTIPTIYDVTDIAYDSQNNTLYILNGYQIPVNDVITINDLNDGSLEVIKALLFKPSIGLATDSASDVFVTTIPEPNSGILYEVNIQSSGVTKIDALDSSLTNTTYFNCLDCTKKSVDISNCQDVIYLNKYSVVQDNYKAKSDIYSNIDIFNNTTYKAGNGITLSNYFSTPSNVDFTAFIESCN